MTKVNLDWVLLCSSFHKHGFWRKQRIMKIQLLLCLWFQAWGRHLWTGLIGHLFGFLIVVGGHGGSCSLMLLNFKMGVKLKLCFNSYHLEGFYGLISGSSLIIPRSWGSHVPPLHLLKCLWHLLTPPVLPCELSYWRKCKHDHIYICMYLYI